MINALDGELLTREAAKPVTDRTGRVMWIPADHTLSPIDQISFYGWTK